MSYSFQHSDRRSGEIAPDGRARSLAKRRICLRAFRNVGMLGAYGNSVFRPGIAHTPIPAYLSGNKALSIDTSLRDRMVVTGGHQTQPRGRKKPNNWQLYDMHGNVDEWCLDWYGPYPGGSVTDPLRDQRHWWWGTNRVARGGRWGDCRSAFRTYNPPDSGGDLIGFRPVLARAK